MPNFEIEPFTPKSAAERKLVDPAHIKPFVARKPKTKHAADFVARLEDSIGLRLGCLTTDVNIPRRSYREPTFALLERRYQKKASTVGEAHVAFDALAVDAVRATFALPWNIVGKRHRAVVGTFEYFPTEAEIDESTGLVLCRVQVGEIKADAENPYYTPPKLPKDPTHIPGAGLGRYVHEGTLGTNTY